MQIEILSEDKSSTAVLQSIMDQLLARRDIRHQVCIRPHRGKGFYPANFWKKPARYASGLMDLLPAKVRAYAEIYDPAELILVVVMDADDEDPNQVYRRLEKILLDFGDRLAYVIGISVEETESWLLADAQAISRAYPQADLALLNQYEQDSIVGTWEFLAAVLYGKDADRIIDIGYPAVGQYKHEWARRISPYLELDRNQSPSFQRFRNRFECVLDRLEAQFDRQES